MSPRENQCRQRRSGSWHWFSRGDNFPCYPLMPLIIVISYWMLIKYIFYIAFGSKIIQVKWIFLFVFRTLSIQKLIRRQSEPMVNCTHIPVHSAQSIFFGISTVVKQYITRCHHMLGRGFMIQQVILIFIKCLSANQNQLFYMKVWYMSFMF